MKFPLAMYYVLATRDVFRDMGSGFREKRETFDPSDFLVWIAVIVGICAVLAWLSRILAQDKHQIFNSPRSLFNALSKAHGLDRQQRTLLKQIAKHHNISPTARLFLEPEWFDLESLSPALREREPAIESIRALLFASDHADEIQFAHPASMDCAEPETAVTAPSENPYIGLPVELPATYGPLRYEQRVRD